MNNVNIIGMLREKIDDLYRYFEYERPNDENSKVDIALIPVRYWTNQPNNIVTSLPIHTRVAIQARLDAHEKFGTILVVEGIQKIN